MYDDAEDDIPIGGPDAKKAKSTESMQISFLRSHIAQRKTATLSRAGLISKPAAPPPVIDLSARNKASVNALAAKFQPLPGPGLRPIRANPVADNISFLPKAATDESFMLFGEILVKNEYQPNAPNNYEKLSKIVKERKAKEKAAKEIAKRLAREHKEEDKKRTKGAAIAPPQALIEDEPSSSSEQNSKPDEKISMPPPSFLPAFGKATSRGLGIAANIMKKHGYKEGQGLGKMEQGMSTALQVEKTGIRGGNIVAEAPKAPTFATNSLEAMKNATKILILANLTSLEELQNEYSSKDEFENEIREEMAKSGEVNNVIVKTDTNEPDEKRQVQVYVEFQSSAQAIKAFVVMNGRFYAGRSVLASFGNIDEYNSLKP